MRRPPPASPDDQVQIGEECEFHIESGGWFGFLTPGFTLIEVRNVEVVQDLPEGIECASESIASGAALNKLDRLIAFSQQFAG